MSVTFKKILRKSPFDKEGTGKYYPQLITWGKPATLNTIAKQMKEKSSLSLGDIKSVLTNFVEAMCGALYNGHSVNIQDFGVFSLSAHTRGVSEIKECTSKNIKSVKINFRASSSVKPNLTSTRAGERIEFLDIMTAVDGDTAEGGGSSSGGGGNTGGGSDGDQGENPLG